MFEKLKDIKNQMKMVNDLKNMVGDVDMKNPSKMFEKLGINSVKSIFLKDRH